MSIEELFGLSRTATADGPALLLLALLAAVAVVAVSAWLARRNRK